MSSTPVPSDFRVTWSFSSLSTFETCPRKYWAEKIAKTTVFEKNEAAQWGEDVHKALENTVRDGAPIPSNMRQYEKIAGKVQTMAGLATETHCEIQFAVDAQDKPTGWNAPSAYGRAIADVFMVFNPTTDPTAVIVDYKTGKFRGSKTQPVINAWMVFKHRPEMLQVKTSFVYIKENLTDNHTFKRETIDKDFGVVRNTLQQLQDCINAQYFPPKKNGLCRQYCSDFTCPHNGRRSI